MIRPFYASLCCESRITNVVLVIGSFPSWTATICLLMLHLLQQLYRQNLHSFFLSMNWCNMYFQIKCAHKCCMYKASFFHEFGYEISCWSLLRKSHHKYHIWTSFFNLWSPEMRALWYIFWEHLNQQVSHLIGFFSSWTDFSICLFMVLFSSKLSRNFFPSWIVAIHMFIHNIAHYLIPMEKIITLKNARAWVSMVFTQNE